MGERDSTLRRIIVPRHECHEATHPVSLVEVRVGDESIQLRNVEVVGAESNGDVVRVREDGGIAAVADGGVDELPEHHHASGRAAQRHDTAQAEHSLEHLRVVPQLRVVALQTPTH